MKIQIVGLGIVGTAQACLSKKLGHNVIGYDPKIKSHQYCNANDSVKDADITFICTPELVAEDVVQSLVDIGHKGIIVIKSTTSIKTTEHISKKFNIHICHNPEFLREQYYLEEIMNPNATIIGQCCQEHGDLLESFYKPIGRPIIRVDATSSELIKLTANAYLSTLITFWNEINELCQKLNLDTKTISDAVGHDPRISGYGRKFFGEPYGGKCLPKDVRHLISGFHSHGLNPKLFDACESFNEDIKKKLTRK